MRQEITRLRRVQKTQVAALEKLCRGYVELWDSATDGNHGECTDAALVEARAAIKRATGE